MLGDERVLPAAYDFNSFAQARSDLFHAVEREVLSLSGPGEGTELAADLTPQQVSPLALPTAAVRAAP